MRVRRRAGAGVTSIMVCRFTVWVNVLLRVSNYRARVDKRSGSQAWQQKLCTNPSPLGTDTNPVGPYAQTGDGSKIIRLKHAKKVSVRERARIMAT
jgi:hypothetical protein